MSNVVRRSTGRRLAGLVMNGLLLVSALAFVLIALGPHLLGYRTATMLTGSMAPGISPGDVVVTVPKPATDLAVGDVISYRIPVEDQRVETHRVTKVIRHADGTIAIRTKGDANPGVDPWTATLADDTVWEARVVVPYAGTAIRTLRAPAVQHGVLWVAFAGLLLLGLTGIWRSGDKTQDKAQDKDTERDTDVDTDRDADRDADTSGHAAGSTRERVHVG